MRVSAKGVIELLPILRGRGWKIDGRGEIRDEKGYCPLCALANEVEVNFFDRIAGSRALIQLTNSARHYGSVAARIMNAADDCGEKALRKQIIAALGIE
jgi:hypothetical protein